MSKRSGRSIKKSKEPVISERLQAAQIAYESGETNLAGQWCDEILASTPHLLEARRLRGLIALQSGEPARGVAELERVLLADPQDLDTRINLGNGYADLGDPRRAIEQYRMVLTRQPDRLEAAMNLAIAWVELGRVEDGLAVLGAHLARNPSAGPAHALRGDFLRREKRWAEAIVAYQSAHTLDPSDSEVLLGLGMALARHGQFADGIHCLNEGIARAAKPSSIAHSERGAAHALLGSYARALEDFDVAIVIDPSNAAAHSSRGNVLMAAHQLDEALLCYDLAIALDPSDAVPVWNKSNALLKQGDLGGGWQLFESRWNAEQSIPRDLPQPLWLGRESIMGKTILLHAEQGLGDTLQFCRYVTRVLELGARVALEVPKPLVRLMQDSFQRPFLAGAGGIEEAAGEVAGSNALVEVVECGNPLPDVDFQCPLMSLPLAFGTQLSTIPCSIPYLSVNRVRTRAWEQRLGSRQRLRVGLVWSSGFRPNQPELWSLSERKNVSLGMLEPLGSMDAEFYSFQKGEPAVSEFRRQAAAGWNGPTIIDLSDELHDFADTAALMENMDLVISVCTSTAHLSGGLGKPTWILLPHDACWRWMLDRQDSPWYPTVTLYRQSTPGEWGNVIASVVRDLGPLTEIASR